MLSSVLSSNLPGYTYILPSLHSTAGHRYMIPPVTSKTYVRTLYCKNVTVVAEGGSGSQIVVVPDGVVEVEIPAMSDLGSFVKVRRRGETVPIGDAEHRLSDAELHISYPAKAFIYRAASSGEAGDLCILIAADDPIGYCLPIRRVEHLKELYGKYKASAQSSQ